MRLILTPLTAAALAASCLVAQAAPIAGQAPVSQSAVNLNNVEKTQFFFGGYNYCWYPVGWHGPGWYWCGYAWRSGFGWGGPAGWRGWRWHGGGPGWHGGGPGWHGGPHGGPRGGHGGRGRH